jgi:hypothetical protein
MGIAYFNCETCGVEMNDCACDLIWWHCSNCDAIYCDTCVVGTWTTCGCSGYDYCEECVKACNVCDCGKFGCWACQGKGAATHSPGCPARPPQLAKKKRRRRS